MSSFIPQGNNLPIPHLSRMLRDRYSLVTPPTRRRIWEAAASGKFPATQAANGRWFIHAADLPLVAAALGVTDRLAPPSAPHNAA